MKPNSPNQDLDAVDRALLNALQKGFPLAREPFNEIGTRLGISGDEALRRVRKLSDNRLLRGIGGVFNPGRMGYRSTLAALRVAPDRLDSAAAVVSANPAVSHNYARDHRFNLWFTLSLPESEDRDRAVRAIAGSSGANECINLPALRVFKLRVYFDMAGDGEGDGGQDSAAAGTETALLEQADKEVIRQLCYDLPIEPRPFDSAAAAAGLAGDDFLSRAKRLKELGVMRRFGATLRHHKAGFTANAMCCWIAPSEAIETIGAAAIAHKEVTHCYERRTAPAWPYNFFAMVHGKSKEECQAVADAISRESGVNDRMMLYSTKEYKKEKVKYFDDALLPNLS